MGFPHGVGIPIYIPGFLVQNKGKDVLAHSSISCNGRISVEVVDCPIYILTSKSFKGNMANSNIKIYNFC